MLFWVCLSTSLIAQMEKGSLIGGISGNLSYGKHYSDFKVLDLSMNPYVLYMVRNNFAIGVDFNNRFTFAKKGRSAPGSFWVNQRIYSITLAPVVRKYFGSGKLKPYAGVTTGLSLYNDYYKSETIEYSNTHKSTKLAAFINPEIGACYWLNDKVFFDAKASYNGLNTYEEANGGFKTIDLKFGIGIKFGK